MAVTTERRTYLALYHNGMKIPVLAQDTVEARYKADRLYRYLLASNPEANRTAKRIVLVEEEN